MHNPLSTEGRQIILGSLLGDGYVGFSGRSRHARFQTSAGLHRKDYIYWKYNLLKPLCIHVPYIQPRLVDGKTFDVWELRTLDHSMFSHMRNKLYPNGKRIVSGFVLNRLTELGIATWFMDDGSLINKRDASSHVVFYLDRYSPSCCDVVRRWFCESLGINAHLHVHQFSKIQRRVQLRLYVNPSDTYNILRPIVTPFVALIPSMAHKMVFKRTALYQRSCGNKSGQSAHHVIREWMKKHPAIVKQYHLTMEAMAR